MCARIKERNLSFADKLTCNLRIFLAHNFVPRIYAGLTGMQVLLSDWWNMVLVELEGEVRPKPLVNYWTWVTSM